MDFNAFFNLNMVY